MAGIIIGMIVVVFIAVMGSFFIAKGAAIQDKESVYWGIGAIAFALIAALVLFLTG